MHVRSNKNNGEHARKIHKIVELLYNGEEFLPQVEALEQFDNQILAEAVLAEEERILNHAIKRSIDAAIAYRAYAKECMRDGIESTRTSQSFQDHSNDALYEENGKKLRAFLESNPDLNQKVQELRREREIEASLKKEYAPTR